MVKPLLLILLGITLCPCPASAASLKACIPDYPNDPISSPDGESSGQRLLDVVMRRQGEGVDYVVAPWARCIAGMASGLYDLIVGVEAESDLFPSIALPERTGKVDGSGRLGTVEYVLVRKTASKRVGSSFTGTSQPVIVPTSGYAATRQLTSAGLTVKAMNYDAGRFMSMLCLNRAEMIVLRRMDFAKALTLCQPERTSVVSSYAFSVADVYVGVRRSLLQTKPELAEFIWREMDRIRSTSDWPADLTVAGQAR